MEVAVLSSFRHPRLLTNMSTLLQNLNLRVDDLTILLILIAATLFLLTNLYRPLALVHPIVLGRQSDVSRARYPKESAVYRNYGTGLVGRVSFILIFWDSSWNLCLVAGETVKGRSCCG